MFQNIGRHAHKNPSVSSQVWEQGDEYVGFVRYQSVAAAAAAVMDWHNSFYIGNRLSVEFARRG